MSLTTYHNDIEFGIGDRIRVIQKIEEGGKSRSSIFEGMVLSIKGRGANQSFLVRRKGEAGIGIERIFPVKATTIEKIELIKSGLAGVHHAKLYYTRDKSPREVDKIYSRAHAKNQIVHAPKKKQ